MATHPWNESGPHALHGGLGPGSRAHGWAHAWAQPWAPHSRPPCPAPTRTRAPPAHPGRRGRPAGGDHATAAPPGSQWPGPSAGVHSRRPFGITPFNWPVGPGRSRAGRRPAPSDFATPGPEAAAREAPPRPPCHRPAEHRDPSGPHRDLDGRAPDTPGSRAVRNAPTGGPGCNRGTVTQRLHRCERSSSRLTARANSGSTRPIFRNTSPCPQCCVPRPANNPPLPRIVLLPVGSESISRIIAAILQPAQKSGSARECARGASCFLGGK